jgi:large subunit ribosomal protein L3
MTQIFLEDGTVSGVTVVEAGPCFVIQKKTKTKDGYDALQLGFLPKKEKRVSLPLRGHFLKAGKNFYSYLREFKVDGSDEYELGQGVTVDIFRAGDLVDVIGVSKGKGFAGVIKRWGFHGGPKTHGSRFQRAPGSIGASAYPARTMKGKRLPGHKGAQRVTVRNVKVADIKPDKNILLLKGSVPGKSGGLVIIRKNE